MITLNAIVQRYGPAYCDHPPVPISRDQRRALHALDACRTDQLGGQVFTCPDCQTTRYSYHSCRNRHCPTCQHDAGQTWLAKQQALLLPVPYFLVTFTLPADLRPLAFANQRQVYECFFRASAAALQQLAQDPRLLGGQLGMLGILQTWTRDLRYHPHIHYLIPAVVRTPDRSIHQPPAGFLLPVRPLAALFRGKLRAAICQLPGGAAIDPAIWHRPWVVDCRPVGTGETALKYLAPYVFRVALSNNRLLSMDHDQVTFRYTNGQTHQSCTKTLPATTFLHQFLQHVLPKGFVKVRYFGLFCPAKRALLRQIRVQLILASGLEPVQPIAIQHIQEAPRCPQCGAVMRRQELPPVVGRAPPQMAVTA